MERFSGAAVRQIASAEVERYLADGRWRDRTMVDDFLDCAASQPHKAAIVTYAPGRPVPETVTFGQLAALSERVALKLLDLGIQRDDVVSIQLPNGWQFAAITLGALRVGAVVNPLVSIFRHNELSFMLGRAEAKMFFVPQDSVASTTPGSPADCSPSLTAWRRRCSSAETTRPWSVSNGLSSGRVPRRCPKWLSGWAASPAGRTRSSR